MAEQRPLDAFVGEDERGVDPIQSTYRWATQGTTCGDCGEERHRFWRENGRLVCPSCKEW